VRLLLDAHTVLWWSSDDRRLSSAVRTAIADTANQLVISAAVGYEIAYKQRRGQFPAAPQSLRRRLLREDIGILPVSLDHALAAAALPGPHRDPWDRIMMAQAFAEHCQMVTANRVFSEYGIPTLW
jgi:PIN domain nuclease of toxin-antitoxin system